MFALYHLTLMLFWFSFRQIIIFQENTYEYATIELLLLYYRIFYNYF